MHNPVSLGSWKPILRRQPAGVTCVALTFDDGPSPDTTPAVLDCLARAQARATFFLTGVRVAAEPGLAADIVAAGHDVYGHGWDHIDHRGKNPSAALSEMMRVEDRLTRLRPTPTPYLVRLPYNAGFNSSRMHRAMAEFHPDIRFAWFSHNTQDYLLADRCASVENLAERCRAVAHALAASDDLSGSIILLHEAPIGVPAPLAPQVTPLLLPLVLEAIEERGLRAGRIHTTHPTRALDRFLFLTRHRATWTPTAVTNPILAAHPIPAGQHPPESAFLAPDQCGPEAASMSRGPSLV